MGPINHDATEKGSMAQFQRMGCDLPDEGARSLGRIH